MREAKLVIPMNGPSPSEGAVSYSKRATRYKVRKGDTVLSVADDFGVPPEKLRRWNHLKGNQLRRGRLLVIYRPVAPGHTQQVAGHRSKSHRKAAKKQSPTAKKTTTASRTTSHSSAAALAAGNR